MYLQGTFFGNNFFISSEKSFDRMSYFPHPLQIGEGKDAFWGGRERGSMMSVATSLYVKSYVLGLFWSSSDTGSTEAGGFKC